MFKGPAVSKFTISVPEEATMRSGNAVMLVLSAVVLGAFQFFPGFAQEQRQNKDSYLQQSPGANTPKDIDEWRKGESRGGLAPYPAAPPGTPNPPSGLYQFGGGGITSFGSPDLGKPFAVFKEVMVKQRPAVDKAARDRLESQFRLDCKLDTKATMSRGKPLPVGPTGKLPKGINNWEEYAALPEAEIKAGNAFPYKPLEHPLHSTAHMLFPQQWTKVHPEHERFDVGFDIP